MKLHDLKPAPGSKKRRKRVGRGPGSGWGKTAGRGHKGQKSRSGYSRRWYFEGGQMPLVRRLPKRGFSNKLFRIEYAIVNLRDISRKIDDTVEVLSPEIMKELGLVKKNLPIKVLGEGELNYPILIIAHKFSKSAQRKIEAAGGKWEVVESA